MTPDGETQRYSGWEIVFNSGWEILLTRNLLTLVGGIFQGEDADHPWLVLLVEVVWGEFQLYSDGGGGGGGGSPVRYAKF